MKANAPPWAFTVFQLTLPWWLETSIPKGEAAETKLGKASARTASNFISMILLHYTTHTHYIYFSHSIYLLTHVFQYTAQSRTLSLKLFRENSSYSTRFGVSTCSRITILTHFSAITWLWFSIIWKLIIQFPWTLCIMSALWYPRKNQILQILLSKHYFSWQTIFDSHQTHQSTQVCS